MRVLKILPFLAILASLCYGQECTDEIDTSPFGTNYPHMIKLIKDKEQMVLEVTNIEMHRGNGQKTRVPRRVRLGSYKDTSFRVFSLTENKIAIIRCKESDGVTECGIMPFSFQVLSQRGKDYDFVSWKYQYITETNYHTDVEKFILYIDGHNNYTLYVNYNHKYVLYLTNDDNNIRTRFNIKEYTANEAEWELIASCFDKGYKCMIDYSDYYLRKNGHSGRSTHPIRRIKEDGNTFAIFHRARFFKTTEGFYYDNFKQASCYSNAAKGVLVVPHFKSADSRKWGLYGDMQDRFQNDKVRTCPSMEDIEAVKSEKMEKPEEEYDDLGNQLRTISLYRSKCRLTGNTMFYVLIATSIFAVIITVLLFGACIVVFIAKKRMRAMGKKLPKKPWETQGAEDCTTFMDQTMGVSTMTTMGGDTSAYTTVAA